MGNIAQGSSKQLRFKRQTAKGTIADGSTGGQVCRRNTSTFNLQKDTYTTESEQTSKRQLTSSRHGARQVNGSLNALLSPGTYSDFVAALLLQDWTAVAPIAGMSLTIAAAGSAWSITRSAGDWLAGGAKIGRVIRLSVGALNAANINKNLLIIGATSTILTVVPVNRRLPLVAEGPIANCTASFPGKLTFVPESAHEDVYYTVEEWFPQVPSSKVSSDVKCTQAQLRMPGTGNVTADFTFLGLDQTKGTTEYFVAPTAESTTDVVTAAGGALFVAGVRKAVITDVSMTIDGRGAVADAVVGDDVRPDVFSGKVMVNGTLTGYFDSTLEDDAFIDETQVSLVLALAGGSGAADDFITMTLSAVKINSSDADDPETGIKRTYNFQATYNKAGGAALATNATTIEVQDSAVA